MKVRVKQAHKSPVEKEGELRWIDHVLGQKMEIDPKEFADNLHEQMEAPKKAKKE